MKLEKVIIEGFRGYRERTEIDISALTALIGENDVGKSSVLEALDAFFNDVVDAQDVNTRIEDGKFKVGCIFSDLPNQINLDAQSHTTLQDECLLNNSGNLEIYKIWRATSAKVEVESIYAWANAPTHELGRDLLFKKRDELKEIVEANGLEADKRKNPDMRQAIYRHLEATNELNLQPREVELDRPKDKGTDFQDARKIWKKLNDRHLPVYSLFKSEQVRGDKETTVRSPLDATLKSTIKKLEAELAPIAIQIQRKVEETTERTLQRLKRDYPELAQSLVPDYKPPIWSKAFDLDVLRGDDDVPLNKRGAGVRRLVVLAFFQAEAEKKRQERAEGLVQPPAIYGIEEPETSQHPNFQRNIIEAFKALVDTGDQVLLTTHVPGLAELLPIDSIRFIDRPAAATFPRVRNGAQDKGVLLEAATSLGVLPSAIPRENAQIAVWVEGDSDVWVLESIAGKLNQAGLALEPLEINRIFFVFGGGGDQLKSVVNGEYLDALGLPQFYLRDSDKEGPDHPGKAIPPEVAERVRRWNDGGEGLPIAVVMTRKREIENYLHPAAVDRICGVAVDIIGRLPNLDFDYGKISKTDTEFWQELCRAKEELEFQLPSEVRRGVHLKDSRPKHVICGLLLPEMTLEEIRERCTSTDPEGAERSEVEEWFYIMAQLVRAVQR
ncbi:MAG: ATP-binding protein [Rhodovibrionaceae bacterium]